MFRKKSIIQELEINADHMRRELIEAESALVDAEHRRARLQSRLELCDNQIADEKQRLEEASAPKASTSPPDAGKMPGSTPGAPARTFERTIRDMASGRVPPFANLPSQS